MIDFNEYHKGIATGTSGTLAERVQQLEANRIPTHRAEDYLNQALQCRNHQLRLAHKYRADLAWLDAHDPEEAKMQRLAGTIEDLVRSARSNHLHALAIRRWISKQPKQTTLF